AGGHRGRTAQGARHAGCSRARLLARPTPAPGAARSCARRRARGHRRGLAPARPRRLSAPGRGVYCRVRNINRETAMAQAEPALLEAIERETGPAPQWSVLWLHGLGADGSDFVPSLSELVLRVWSSMRFGFPPATVAAVLIN